MSSPEVSKCYFPMRNGCKVTLYQDAHTPEHSLHEQIQLADGTTYKPRSAFKDIYEAISGAKHFILVADWSFDAEISLLRGKDDDQITLGDLLKKKAEENVLVAVMAWQPIFGLEKTVRTGNINAAEYFKGSGVHFKLVPRSIETTWWNPVRAAIDTYGLSHHQKTVVVDLPISSRGSGRKLVAFLGGLDLTGGRWDTPLHPLYSSLQAEHKHDFYNRHVKDTKKFEKFGPRKPWHDIHCRLEGEAAVDVYRNFTERWECFMRGGQLYQIGKAWGLLGDTAPSKIPDLLKKMEDDGPDGNDPGRWNVQLFRSITSASAAFDENNGDANMTLRQESSTRVDDSILRAYIHHIRRAQNFIYIENQYIIGGSRAWKEPKDYAEHAIPLELANKIARKILTGQRFAVYIVIPMFPEGDAESSRTIQQILHCQHQTMQMMYHEVARAIKEKGTDAKPTDYLNFYYLAKQECAPSSLPEPKKGTPEDTERRRLQAIYVHSKMMIVDDEYIIVGSANINQRSMDGNRDTEIAMGAYQPAHMIGLNESLPKGEVHAFRMALWAEHLAMIDPSFQNPGSLKCVQTVEDRAILNVRLRNCHLLMYPEKVSPNGDLQPEEFPGSSVSCGGIPFSLFEEPYKPRLMAMSHP